MRVAVTGAGGRLGSSLIRLLRGSTIADEVLGWDLPEHDLDDPLSARRLVEANRPDVVIHCAAWTDVDGCARQPEVALRRNGLATGEMAEACVAAGASMIMISTNEVFDGRRTDRTPYSPADRPSPANAYGTAKLAGEIGSRAAFGVSGGDFATAAMTGADAGAAGATADTGRATQGGALAPRLAIVRTAWLFGLPGSDFPQKILAAARRSQADGSELSLVSDEIGSPTYAMDLAAAIVALLAEANRPSGRGFGGIHHIVNGGAASRADWARRLLALAGVDVPTRDVPANTWPRPSTPPLWGVLEATPGPGGSRLRDWRDATAEYIKLLPPHTETPR